MTKVLIAGKQLIDAISLALRHDGRTKTATARCANEKTFSAASLGGRMHTTQACRIAVNIIIFGWMTTYAPIAASENMDVNMAWIYLGTKTQKDSDLRGEFVLQYAFPLSDSSRETGYGLLGGIGIDTRTFANVKGGGSSSTMGVGKIYYSFVPASTSHTFVPFLTLYRKLIIDFNQSGGVSSSAEQKAWLPPGFMYAYRMSDETVFHIDAEKYSYSKAGNYRAKVGVGYELSQQWVISLSHERLSWDINPEFGGSVIFTQGNSQDTYLKVGYRSPSKLNKWNVSFIAGYGSLSNIAAPALPQQSTFNSKGPILGIEVSGGNLVW